MVTPRAQTPSHSHIGYESILKVRPAQGKGLIQGPEVHYRAWFACTVSSFQGSGKTVSLDVQIESEVTGTGNHMEEKEIGQWLSPLSSISSDNSFHSTEMALNFIHYVFKRFIYSCYISK